MKDKAIGKCFPLVEKDFELLSALYKYENVISHKG